MRFLVFLLLLMVSSCLVLPAPHRHKYKRIDVIEKNSSLIVFCTPGLKMFVFSDESNGDVEFCSKVIHGNCQNMNIENYFGQNEYVSKEIRMSEREFKKLFNNDTLVLKIISLNKEYKYVPIIGSR